MDWSEFAHGVLKGVRTLGFASGLGPENSGTAATLIRKASAELTELAKQNGMLVGQETPPHASDAVRRAWRGAIPGLVRCGPAVQPSTHEVILSDAMAMISLLHERLPCDDDAALVTITRRVFDVYLDRNVIADLDAGLALEWESAEALKTEAVYLGNGLIEVGHEQLRLTDSQNDVIQALVELGAAGLTELGSKSGRESPQKTLKAVIARYPALAPHIKLPGGKSKGGYSTTILDGR